MLKEVAPDMAGPQGEDHNVLPIELMSPATSLQEPSIDIGQKQLEITHEGQSDFILNNDAALATEWGPRLKEFFRDGVPLTWQVIGGGGRNVMMGEIDGKRFVAKLRNKRLDEGDLQMSDDEWAKVFGPSRRVVRADESLINEMHMAPKIKEALITDETQTTIRESGTGISGVGLAEPIMGVVSRKPNPELPYTQNLTELGWHGPTADKFIVYEWFEGVCPNEQQGDTLVGVVTEALHRGRVQESDLRADQFIISSSGMAYLMDTEEFMNLTDTSAEEARV